MLEYQIEELKLENLEEALKIIEETFSDYNGDILICEHNRG